MKKKLFDFLIEAHKDQKYDGDHYLRHLIDTFGILSYLGVRDPDLGTACLCHDVLEDTDKTEQDLLDVGVSPRALEIIKAVTDEPGKNRRERKAKTYPKIMKDPDAALVKFCDRFSNILSGQTKYREMYKKEHDDFCSRLVYPAMTSLLKHGGESDKFDLMFQWCRQVLNEESA